MRHLRIGFLSAALTLTLAGCGIFDWADEHMPVIGQRCMNWQCFTESGQQQSRLNQMQTDQAAAQGRKPANAPGTPGAPLTQPQPGAPAPGGTAANPNAPTPDAYAVMNGTYTGASAPAAATAPAAPDASAPATPLAPPMPAQGAYIYVPRGPAEPGTTPFDSQMSR